jgi:hypothetical protein
VGCGERAGKNNAGLLWSTLVYFDLLWSTLIYFGLLWSTLIYFGLL